MSPCNDSFNVEHCKKYIMSLQYDSSNIFDGIEGTSWPNGISKLFDSPRHILGSTEDTSWLNYIPKIVLGLVRDFDDAYLFKTNLKTYSLYQAIPL
jgi:hypothetical protein